MISQELNDGAIEQ